MNNTRNDTIIPIERLTVSAYRIPIDLHRSRWDLGVGFDYAGRGRGYGWRCHRAWLYPRRYRNCETYLSARFRRLAARQGKKCAIVAIAYSLWVIIYHVLRTKQPYHDLGADYFDHTRAAQLKCYLVKRLENLGLQVTVQNREEVVSLAT